MSGFICATGTEAGGGDTIQDIRLVGGEQDNNLKTPLVLFVATPVPHVLWSGGEPREVFSVFNSRMKWTNMSIQNFHEAELYLLFKNRLLSTYQQKTKSVGQLERISNDTKCINSSSLYYPTIIFNKEPLYHFII